MIMELVLGHFCSEIGLCIFYNISVKFFFVKNIYSQYEIQVNDDCMNSSMYQFAIAIFDNAYVSHINLCIQERLLDS